MRPGANERHGHGFTPTERQAILHRDPICRVCHTRPSTIVDHVIPRSESGPTTPANAQGLCSDCHTQKTQQEQARGRARRSPRRPPEPHPGLR